MKYLWAWAAAGVIVPILGAVIGYFMPPPPEWNPFEEPKVSPSEHRLAVAATMLFPAMYVGMILSLAVTDAGGDSGALVAGGIIFAISALLNAVYYMLVGLFLWPVVTRLNAMIRGAPS
jgi:hypothetical protein